MAAQYSAEDHAKAWASYYAQQGYTPEQILASTGYDTTTSKYVGSATASTSYGASSSTAGPSYDSANAYGAGPSAGINSYVFEGDVLAQSSIYDPTTAAEMAAKAPKAKPIAGKRETVIRKGNGKTWEDTTLIDWDPKWYRLFVGDCSNDVNERTLDNAFGVYPSYCKSKVIRDRLSLKAKYGFIAFKDPEDFLKAWKEMDGKYVGQRPIRLMKIKEDKYGSIATSNVSGKKARDLDKLAKNRGKPLDGRPVPY